MQWSRRLWGIKTNKIKVYIMIKVSAESKGCRGVRQWEKGALFFCRHLACVFSDDRRGFQSTYEIFANGIDLRSPRGLRGGKKIILKFYASQRLHLYKYNITLYIIQAEAVDGSKFAGLRIL